MKNVLTDISLCKTTLILFCTLISLLSKVPRLFVFIDGPICKSFSHTATHDGLSVENESLLAQTNLTHSQ